MFSRKPSEEIKVFKSRKEDEINIDVLVDNLLINKTKNDKSFSLKKSRHLRITKDFFKEKLVNRVLSGFILFLLFFALWASNIPSLYGDFDGSDFIVSLEPRAVYNGDTIEIKVSVPGYYNISSLSVDMGSNDSVDLFLIDNSSDYHIWIGDWVVQNMSPGYYIARVVGSDFDNLTYFASVEWKVMVKDNTSIDIDSENNIINEIDKTITYDSTNESEFVNQSDDLINDTNFSEENDNGILVNTIQLDGVIGQPVKWIKEIKIVNSENRSNMFFYNVSIPSHASQIETSFNDLLILDENISTDNLEEKIFRFNVTLDAFGSKIIFINYSTTEPILSETIINEKTKRVVISSDFGYSNITAFTDINNQPENKISLYHILNDSKENMDFTTFDFDVDGFVDRIEWLVPHLSEQVYEVVIEVEKAEHLDNERNYVSDISDEVKSLDGVWSEPIYDGEFVRVTFVQSLVNGNDITIFARSGGVSDIEVFTRDSNELISIFDSVTGEGWYKIYLSNLTGGFSTFDLRSVGDFVEYDYIVDPPSIVLLNPSPNGTTGVGLQPTCQIWANDTEGDTLTVYWYENTTGDWVLRQTNSSVSANSTVSWVFSQASNYGSIYWWKVAVDDGSDNISEWYSFITGIDTSVDDIVPYVVNNYPFDVNATGDPDLDNVTLYYRWSDDNSTWEEYYYDWYNDTVDDNTCNVDGVADKGTETNFANCRDVVPDADVMTIQEADQDSGTSTLGKTSGTGINYRTITGNDMRGQVFTATSSGEIYQASFWGRGDSGTVNVKFVICDSTGYILTNGVSNSVSVTTTANLKTATWTAGSRPIVESGSTYWIMIIPSGNLRLYYSSTSSGNHRYDSSNNYNTPTNPTDAISGTDNYRILYADIYNLDYEADMEYQFNNTNYGCVYEYLCLYLTGTVSENLLVDYWNVSAWENLGTINKIGWNNFTATGLTSSTYNIRIRDQNQTAETTQHSWTVDCIFLQTYNFTYWIEWSNANNPDEESPWNWSFDFPNGSGYYEFYSIGTNGSFYESAPTNADAICAYSRRSTISNEEPSNESIGIQILPPMNITINDLDGDSMVVTWYSNSSGSWQAFGSNVSVGNGTYHQINNNFSNYFTTYWWYVTVSDGINTNTSGTFHFTTIAALPTIYTNTSIGVEETNATLCGYLQNNGGLETTCGFRYGTSSGSYTENYTKGTYPSNTEFNNNNDSLTPGQIYFYQAWATNSIGFVNGSEKAFLTKPQAPTNLNAQQNNSSIIYLTWIKGTGANNTYIERNTTGVTSWDKGQGTMIYNGSGMNYEDTGLVQGTVYYYQAWSYTTWTDTTTLQQWSDDNASNSNKTNNKPTIEPLIPLNGSTIISPQPTCQIWANDTDGNALTIDWYENTTGSWILRQTNTSVSANSTLNWIFTQANSYGATYWWRVDVNDSLDNVTFWYYFTTNSLNTSVDSISPYVISTSPLTITATNYTSVDNVTLYYRWSDDNASWGHSGETTYDTPTIDNIASEPNNVNVNSMSWTHAVSSGLNNSILIVGVNLEDDDVGNNFYVASADFNNDALTRAERVAADEGTAAVSEIWYLLNPDVGSYTVRVNFSVTINQALGGSVSFSNVKQSAPFNTNTAANTGDPAGLATSVNTEVTNSLMIAVATDGQGFLAYSYGSGQTEIYDVAGSTHEGAGSRKLSTVGGSSTMYTNLSAASNRMSQVVAAWTPTSITWGNGTNWIQWSNSSNPDTSSPWSWDFDFPNGTGYYEFYSVGKKSGSPDESAPVSADARCRYNRLPTITNEVPGNGSTNIQLIPQLSISVNDIDGDGMNVTWYSNSSGSWQVFGVNNSVLNGTYYQINSNFSSPGTTYWWNVSVYDGVHTNNSGIFHFTTSYQPVLSNPGPSNNSNGQYITPICNVTVSDADSGTITVRFYENTTGVWVLQQINSSVDVTNPANVVWNNFSNATGDYTTYWWLVNVSDGKGCFVEAIYHFTTANTSIDITPDRWDQGVLQVGGSNETSGFYFNLTNNGDTNLYIQIKASNATNISTGGKWILNSSSGFDNFTLQYNKSSGGAWTTINLTYDLFVSSLDAGAWQTFDLKLIMATLSSTVDPLSLDLTFRSIKA